jgi:UDP-N-acetylmuramoyl-L-alanyl-D-glutamate--2,6-diaminopimelate ligase
MGEIAARLSDVTILTSDNPRSEDPLTILAQIEDGLKAIFPTKFASQDPAAAVGIEKGYFVEPERRAAIRLALGLARDHDLVLIAGKGHEDYQILGKNRIHFDDREVAQEELAQLRS